MKKLWILGLAVCLLVGCGAPVEESTGKETTEIMPSTSQETVPGESTEEMTLPPHSALYREDISLDQITEYFNEVVFSTEYAEGDGDPALVQKWEMPVLCTLEGTPTDEDKNVLTELFDGLNQIDGFPGISFAAEGQMANVTLYFLNEEGFDAEFADFLHHEPADGAVQFWYYTDTNEIHTARVGYRTDISQELRNSVLLEEIVNLLGLNDTQLRQDSIVYQYGSEVTALSQIDWLILQILYHPSVTCGMDPAAFASVLPTIYY